MNARVITRTAAAGALAAGILTATAGPSAAAGYTSPGYETRASCEAAQRAWQSSWTRVTKSCYSYLVTANGVSLDYYKYRFEGVTR